MHNKILIIGGTGFVGSKLITTCPKKIKLWSTYRIKPLKSIRSKQIKLDLLDLKTFKKKLNNIQPKTIIFTARLNPFDDDIEKHAEIMGKFIKQIEDKKTKFIYLSSDAVFDGKKGNYKEQDKTNPQTNYGYAKLAAEKIIKKELKNYIIIRTGHIFGQYNDGQWDKRTAKLITDIKQNRIVYRFKDMFRSPILVDDLCAYIWTIANTKFAGTIHIAGKKTNIYEFSKKLAKKLGYDPNIIQPNSYKNSQIKEFAPDASLDTTLSQKYLNIQFDK